MGRTPEEVIGDFIESRFGPFTNEATKAEVAADYSAALDTAGYEIQEKGVLYAGPLKATADRDIFIVTHRENLCDWPIEVFFDGRDIMCRPNERSRHSEE